MASLSPRYFRKVIRISGLDSPNVRLALAQKEAGKEPTNEILLPGVLTYADYQKRLATWDEVRICVGVYGQFYKGAEVLLFPPLWLNKAEDRARELLSGGLKKRRAKALGVDSAEGGDSSVWTVIDDLGILEQESRKTSDTNDIPGITLALLKKYDLEPEDVVFDRGGGGKQHADRLRSQGYEVRTVGFGEAATDPHLYTRVKTKDERRETSETRYEYKNRRAEMYGISRNLFDPLLNPLGFGVPATLVELRRQLAPLPLLYDGEGRMYLPPKDKPSPNYTGKTIREMLGRSPDEADSFVLAVFGMLVKKPEPAIGVLF